MSIAVIKTGGKQYKVKEGDTILIEKISTEKEKIVFDDILNGKKVEAKIIESLKGPKIHILKFKAKTRYKRTNGHRQQHVKIQIEAIK